MNSDILWWTIIIIAVLIAVLVISVTSYLAGKRGAREEVRSAIRDAASYAAHNRRLQGDLETLLFAARPLTHKTAWSFVGVETPHVRQEEVARNQSAERLRQTMERITGDTMRPRSLEEDGTTLYASDEFPFEQPEDER